MGTLKFCDRCHREVSNTIPDMLHHVKDDRAWKAMGTNPRIDVELCNSCYFELERWLKNTPSNEVRDEPE